jgi:hypothetical protein
LLFVVPDRTRTAELGPLWASEPRPAFL